MTSSAPTTSTTPSTAQKEEEVRVCVAVNVRPLVGQELDDGCSTCMEVQAGSSQVKLGQHSFSYDYVFGEQVGGQSSQGLYSSCVAPLVDGLFRGYNATVFAYGQTGSGKSYTMGSECKPGVQNKGVIPDAIGSIFDRVASNAGWEYTIRISFVEIYKVYAHFSLQADTLMQEEVRDLLVTGSGPRTAVSIHSKPEGGVQLHGAVEKVVNSKDELIQLLAQGTNSRSTGGTNMNSRSSRSHAIFTITLEQRRVVSALVEPKKKPAEKDKAAMLDDDDDDDDDDILLDDLDDYLCAKMHLVDLAGSERAKRTKAQGARLKEGIHINRGLLALGNVINAIVDNKGHVPYRDSKLTRLLQDSLGGNSRTVMIACASPADSNYEETLNTLRYADRARHIRNKPTVNRDPVSAQIAHLTSIIAQLKAENEGLKRMLKSEGADDVTSLDPNDKWRVMIEGLQQDKTLLEQEVARLNLQMDEMRAEAKKMQEQLNQAKAIEMLIAKQKEAMEKGVEGSFSGSDVDVVKQLLARIAGLEKENKGMKAFHSLARNSLTGADGHAKHRPSHALSDIIEFSGNSKDIDVRDKNVKDLAGEVLGKPEELEAILFAEMAAHKLQQDRVRQEVSDIQRQVAQKEKKLKELMDNAKAIPPDVKQKYDVKLKAIAVDLNKLMDERKALQQRVNELSRDKEANADELRVLGDKEKELEAGMKGLRDKQKQFISLQTLDHRLQNAKKALQQDLDKLKSMVAHKLLDVEEKNQEFLKLRAEREAELQVIKKKYNDQSLGPESMEVIEEVQQKREEMLKRKVQDAAVARKKLQEALKEQEAELKQSQNSLKKEQIQATVEIQPNPKAPVLKTDKQRREWLAKEIDTCNTSYEYKAVIEGELALRAEASHQLKEVQKKLMLLDQVEAANQMDTSGSGSKASSFVQESRDKLLDMKARLEKQIQEHNSQIHQLQQQADAQRAMEQDSGRGAADRHRFSGVKAVEQAKELLFSLFRLAADNKAQANEYFMEMIQQAEELDLARVAIDSVKKENDSIKKRSAAIEAAAASVLSSSSTGPRIKDESEKQVDKVLAEIKQLRKGSPDSASANGEVMRRVLSAHGAIQRSGSFTGSLAGKEEEPKGLVIGPTAARLLQIIPSVILRSSASAGDKPGPTATSKDSSGSGQGAEGPASEGALPTIKAQLKEMNVFKPVRSIADLDDSPDDPVDAGLQLLSSVPTRTSSPEVEAKLASAASRSSAHSRSASASKAASNSTYPPRTAKTNPAAARIAAVMQQMAAVQQQMAALQGKAVGNTSLSLPLVPPSTASKQLNSSSLPPLVSLPTAAPKPPPTASLTRESLPAIKPAFEQVVPTMLPPQAPRTPSGGKSKYQNTQLAMQPSTTHPATANSNLLHHTDEEGPQAAELDAIKAASAAAAPAKSRWSLKGLLGLGSLGDRPVTPQVQPQPSVSAASKGKSSLLEGVVGLVLDTQRNGVHSKAEAVPVSIKPKVGPPTVATFQSAGNVRPATNGSLRSDGSKRSSLPSIAS